MGGKNSYESIKRYRDKAYDNIMVRVYKGKRAEIKTHAVAHGESLTHLLTGRYMKLWSGITRKNNNRQTPVGYESGGNFILMEGFTMGHRYAHVTWRERLKIETRLKDGWGPQRIADELGRHVSTIYREKKRGLGIQRTTDLIDYECYILEITQAKYEETFSNKGSNLKIGKDHEYANHLGDALKGGERSPQAALGEIEAQGLEFETKISVRMPYRYIDMDFIPGASNKDLPKRS